MWTREDIELRFRLGKRLKRAMVMMWHFRQSSPEQQAHTYWYDILFHQAMITRLGGFVPEIALDFAYRHEESGNATLVFWTKDTPKKGVSRSDVSKGA